MIFGPLLILPAFLSLVVLWLSSVEKATLWVYLPTLLLVPDYFYFGLPPLSFAHYAIIPIGIAICLRAINGQWKWSVLDALVGAFVVWNFVSDFHAIGFVDISERIASPITLSLFPYMIGKGIIEQRGVRVQFIRRFVFCLFLDCVISAYEFRMGKNPVRDLIMVFFPRSPWHTQLRWGFGRASGPFGHAILMGSVVGIAIILHRYLTHLGLWEQRFRLLPKLPLSKERLIFFALLAGSLMTLSRGPWIATAVGVVLAACGTSSLYKRAFRRVAVTLVVGGLLIFLVGKAYLAQPSGRVATEEQASAQYRSVLVDRYQEIALRQGFWGWGTTTWPKLPGMASIDNNYLLVTLMYGVTGLVLYGLMLGVGLTRLLGRALSSNELASKDRSLLFALAGISVTIAVSTTTVYLGEQLYPLLFLFLGWGEACLLARPSDRSTLAEPMTLDWQPKFQFPSIIS